MRYFTVILTIVYFSIHQDCELQETSTLFVTRRRGFTLEPNCSKERFANPTQGAALDETYTSLQTHLDLEPHIKPLGNANYATEGGRLATAQQSGDGELTVIMNFAFGGFFIKMIKTKPIEIQT